MTAGGDTAVESTHPGLTADGARSPADAGGAAAWEPPPTFDEYRLIRRLGAGAMGEVYLAEDLLLAREVAVKFVRAGDGASDAASERFYTEARAIARLTHPHVVAVYRVGRVRRRPYLVSEYVAGRSLDRIELPLAPARVIEIGAALASGLAAAHRRGVLHRDLKPANAMISDAGEVKLLDFGLAKLVDDTTAASALPAVSAAVPVGGPVGEKVEIDVAATGDGAGDAGVAVRTRPGAIVGSPLYMAPELWRGEDASVASDLYALGILLYELAAGRPPRAELTIDALRVEVVARDAPALGAIAPDVPRALAAVIERAIAREPAARFASADAMRLALDGARSVLDGRDRDAGDAHAAPYRGLHPFGAEHRALFHGRDADVRAVIDRLRIEPFVLIVGDSGVGKSSLCAAGVLPRALAGGLDDGRTWSAVTLVPGRHPRAALARALAPAIGLDEEAIDAALGNEPGAIDRTLRRALGSTRGLIVQVDQLEELIAVADPDQAAAAAEALGAIAQRAPGLRLLATARSDFLTKLAALPRLGPEIGTALHLLPPLDDDGVRDAIVGPARLAGVGFESEALVAELAASAQGNLPLLQFTLAALWEARDRDRAKVPAAALAALGGVGGALARHADGVIERLLPDERAAARRILLALVTAEGTRARRDAAELDGSPAGRRALDALVRGRLVVARDGGHELAHEVLVTAWGTLRAWMGGDLERRAAAERLARAAADWDRLGRPADALAGARQLAELDALGVVVDAAEEAAPSRERAFVAASRRARRRARWLRRGLVIAALAGAAAIYGGVRYAAARDRDRRVDAQLAIADRAGAVADEAAARRETARRDAIARFDRAANAAELEQAEDAWGRALTLAAALDEEHVRAERALELALSIDPGRASLRRRFATLLLARALDAERAGDAALARARADRAALYDPVLARRWNAPARLTLATDPPGATVDAIRYGDDPRRTPGPSTRLGTTPLADVALAPGSYLVTLTAPGRPALRYPILVGRGESLRADVAIPASVPDGFVHVAPGRFLYGSGDLEPLRRGLWAQPIHPVTTGAYLIARHELTFADWITYLDALDPDTRARRTPRAANEQGLVALAQDADGTWRLSIAPEGEGGATLTAAGDAPLVYPGRTTRATQRWQHLPVTGISWEDLVAYTAWLDETGRVPGARPCTEHEWERAARGADARSFPHADVLAPDDADHDATYGRRKGAYGPDEVGSYPASDSPFGVADLTGNAYEWARSMQTNEVVMRGASFYRDAFSNQVTNRSFGAETMRNAQTGARLCADPRGQEAP